MNSPVDVHIVHGIRSTTTSIGTVSARIQSVQDRPAESMELEKFTRPAREPHLGLANGPVKIVEGDVRDAKAVHDSFDGMDLATTHLETGLGDLVAW